jgi:plastocyanin
MNMRKIQFSILGVIVLAAVSLARVFGSVQAPATQPGTVSATTEPSAACTCPATTRPIAGGTIRGRVTISGDWSLQKPDLTRVVVYLASDPSLDSHTPPTGHATIAQRHRAFVPNFAVVERGTTVEFPNWDNFDHNVFSLSKAAPAFDLDRYPRGQSKSRVFDKVGVVQLFCNIHPFMRAMVVVTPNAYFARADGDGQFEIPDVPPGKYELVAWQEHCDDPQQNVVVGGPGTTSDVSIELREKGKSIVSSEAAPTDKGYGVESGMGLKREKLNLPVVKDSHPAPDPEPQ